MSEGIDPRQLQVTNEGVDPRSLFQQQGVDPRSLNAKGTDPRKLSPNVTPEQTWPDVLTGSPQYEAAETGSLLVRSVNRSLGFQDNSLEEFAQSLDNFRKSHPEYAPAEVENTLDLISNPKALTSRILGSAAYTGLMMGSSTIPAAGWLVTGLTAYGIESQRAYESAKAFGATEQEAETAAKHTGLANAMFQVVMSTRMLSALKGEEGALSSAMGRSSNSIVRALGPAAELSKDAGVLGALNAFQGAIDDKIALDTYGKPFDSNFWDHRLQEGALGAATTLLIGAPRSALKTVKIIRNSEGAPIGEAEINVFDRSSAFRFFQSNGVPRDTAQSMAAVADSMASQYAMDTGKPKESFFPSVINERNFELKSNGNALQTQIKSVFDSFESDPATTIKTFLKSAVSQFPADKIEKLKTSLGVKDTTPPHEADAKVDSAFIRYLWEGEAPSPETAAPLEDLKQLLRDTYKNVTSLGAKKIGLETKILFDSMLAPETEEITTTRRRLESAKTEIDKNFPKEFKPSSLLTDEDIKSLTEPIREETTKHEFAPDLNVTKEIKETVLRPRTREELAAKAQELIAERMKSEPAQSATSGEALGMVEGVPRTRADAQLLIEDLTSDLDRLRMGRLSRDDLSAVERRSSSEGYQRDRLLLETGSDTRDRNSLMERIKSKALDPVRQQFDQVAPIRRWKNGQILESLLMDKDTLSRKDQGRLQGGIREAWTSLTWRERKWLRQVDSDGFTNMQKLLDPTGVVAPLDAPSQGLKDFQRFNWEDVNAYFGRQAERQGTLMRFPDGKHRPYHQPEIARMLRLSTEEFSRAMRDASGPIYNAIIEAAKRFNPELAKMTTEKIGKMMKEVFVDAEVKSNSSLETARIFKILPSVIDVQGRKVTIFHNDPLVYMQNAVRVQADRLAWGKVFGQKSLESVPRGMVSWVADRLGVTPSENVNALVNRIRQRVLGTSQERLDQNFEKSSKEYGNSSETVVENLLSKLRDVEGERGSLNVVDPLTDAKSLQDAIKIAKDLRISLKPTRQEYIDAIGSITATNMNAKQKNALVSVAKKVQGIDTNLPPHELLSEIKRRVAEDAFNNLETLKLNLSRESAGAADPYADRIIKMSQGIPVDMMERNFWTRSLKFLSQDVAGTLQTSLSALLQPVQTMMLVPAKAGVGNWMSAVGKAITDFKNTKTVLETIGAVPSVMNSWGFEKGYFTENLGKFIRQGIGKATFFQLFADFNNVVAGEAYQRYAEGLMERNLSEGRASVTSSDVTELKSLGLSGDEISQIQSGQMSNLVFSKIIQNGVDNTQFMSKPNWRKGKLEVSPIGKILFPYFSYAIGTGQAIGNFMQHGVVPALNPKNWNHPSMPALVVRDAAILVAGTLGAGFLSQSLVNIARGTEMRDADESWLDKSTGALTQMALMGPAVRMLDAFHYSGSEAWIVGMMPQVRFLGDFFGVFANEIHKAVTGKTMMQRYGNFGFMRNLGEWAKSNTPIAKAIFTTLDNAAYPELVDYQETRNAVAKYSRDRSEVERTRSTEPLDPFKESVYFYVSRGDAKNAMIEAQNYYVNYVEEMTRDPQKAVIQDMSPQKAMESLRATLSARSPINLTERATLDFLSKLDGDRVREYYIQETKYNAIVDSVAPKQRK